MHAVLRFGREVAFSAATVYASAAEARGAWDARLEALVVDAVVRGEAEEVLLSRAVGAGLGPGRPRRRSSSATRPPRSRPTPARRAPRRPPGRRHGAAGHPRRAPGDDRQRRPDGGPGDALGELSAVLRPRARRRRARPSTGLVDAHHSAGARPGRAPGGRRAWPGAPRPVAADALLPERVLAGDAEAVAQLVRDVATPLREAGGGLTETVEAYLDHAGVLEACARHLFVHPNTVRYRLRRVADLTGRHPGDARGALALRLALDAGPPRPGVSR